MRRAVRVAVLTLAVLAPAAREASPRGSVLDVRHDAPVAGFAWTGVSGGLERAALPGTLRLGVALDGAYVPEAERRPLAYHFALGPRAELALSRSTSGWIGVALEKRQQGETASTAPALEVGVQTTWRTLDARAGLRHVLRQRAQPPVQIWSRMSSPIFPPPDTSQGLPYWAESAPEPVAVTALELGADWTGARWAFEGTGGVAVGSGFAPVPLASVRAVHWARADLGVVLGVRAAVPGWIARDFDGHRRVELGVRFAPGRSPDPVIPGSIDTLAADEPPAWKAVRRAAGYYVLRVRAPGAARVALRGDFTRWTSIDLTPHGGAWWETALPIPPGLHEVEVAIDGREWEPPPGALTTQGTYGQTVGLLVAE